MASESKTTVINMAAAAVATSAVAFVSLGFISSPGAGAPLAHSPHHFLSPGPSASTFTGETLGVYSVATGVAVGLAASLVTAARLRIARQSGFAEYKEQPAFASGLVGSEYGGYGRHEFDPAGLASRFAEHLPWYREAELKHSRVAMLACVGLIVPDAIRIPLDTFESPDLNLVNAHNKLIGPGLGEGAMWWVLIFCAVIESTRFKQLGLQYENLTLENAGDIGFGKAFLPKSEEGQVAMKIKELKNGRLAMMGFSGAITQAVIYDSPHFPFVPN